MDRKIIDTAFAFDGWVYGGWVRDVCVLGRPEFNDIDLCFPDHADIHAFISVLKTHMPTLEAEPLDYARHRLIVGTHISVDIVIVDGTFEDWLNMGTTDLSCNLFYKTKTVELGLRYVPSIYKSVPNPLDYVKCMTLCRHYDILTEPTEKIAERIEKLKGWTNRTYI
jgi:hypothetical protein